MLPLSIVEVKQVIVSIFGDNRLELPLGIVVIGGDFFLVIVLH
jgi:hypothetical protein